MGRWLFTAASCWRESVFAAFAISLFALRLSPWGIHCRVEIVLFPFLYYGGSCSGDRFFRFKKADVSALPASAVVARKVTKGSSPFIPPGWQMFEASQDSGTEEESLVLRVPLPAIAAAPDTDSLLRAEAGEPSYAQMLESFAMTVAGKNFGFFDGVHATKVLLKPDQEFVAPEISVLVSDSGNGPPRRRLKRNAAAAGVAAVGLEDHKKKVVPKTIRVPKPKKESPRKRSSDEAPKGKALPKKRRRMQRRAEQAEEEKEEEGAEEKENEEDENEEGSEEKGNEGAAETEEQPGKLGAGVHLGWLATLCTRSVCEPLGSNL